MRAYLTREHIFFFIVTILCMVVISPFWFPFVCGVTLAFLLEAPVNRLLTYFRLEGEKWKWVLSLVTVLVILLAVLGPILTLITTGVQELISLLSLLQADAKGKGMIFQGAQQLSHLLHRIGVEYSIDEIFARLRNIVESEANLVFAGAGTAIFATPQFLLKTFIFIFTWCFFLVYGKDYRERFLSKIFPWKKERNLIASTMSSLLKALIVANIFVGFIQALLITITLAAFGLPRYVLFGLIGFFLSFVPLLGTAPLMIGIAAWCFFSEDRLGAAIGVLVCAVLIGISDNILRPFLMKGSVEINFFWILLALFGGMASFGFAGVILGPVVFALFGAALKALEIHDNNKLRDTH